MEIYDIVELMKSENVNIGSWINHVSDTIACPAFYNALNNKHPMTCKIETNHYNDLFNICLVLDLTTDFPGFNELRKDYDDIAFCYSMNENQYKNCLDKLLNG